MVLLSALLYHLLQTHRKLWGLGEVHIALDVSAVFMLNAIAGAALVWGGCFVSVRAGGLLLQGGHEDMSFSAC